MTKPIQTPITATDATALKTKEAAISAKVAAIPVRERFDLAVELARKYGDKPTDEQVLEFSKLFFGPNVKVTKVA